MMKNSLTKLAPAFNTNRMVREYVEKYYMKAYHNWKNLSDNGFVRTKNLMKWKQFIRDNWHQVKIVNAGVQKKEAEVGFALKIETEIKLGDLKPDDVQVQVLSGLLDSDYNIVNPDKEIMKCVGQESPDMYKYEGYIPCDESGLWSPKRRAKRAEISRVAALRHEDSQKGKCGPNVIASGRHEAVRRVP